MRPAPSDEVIGIANAVLVGLVVWGVGFLLYLGWVALT